MKPSDFGPLLIVISRDEVLRQDISGPLATLKNLVADRETIRANMTNVDISFDGYENTPEELFEIPEVRNYVYALNAKFPYWLYFLSRHFMGLQCVTYCYLLPHLTEEARRERHPEQLADLVDGCWGPALFEICSAAGHTESETEGLLNSSLVYFKSGPTAISGDDDGNDVPVDRYALLPSQEYVRTLLENACRTVLARPDQGPHSLLLGALFLRAVRVLPNMVDQFPVSLSWKIEYDGSWATKTVTIGHESLSFDTTEAFNSGAGWDHESSVDWSVDESRQRGLDEWVLEDVLEGFARDVGDADCQVGFGTDYDHPFEDIANDPEPVSWFSAFPGEE